MAITFDHGGNVFAVARALGIPPEELLDFSASINPLGPAPGVKEAVCAAFDRLVHYPDSGAVALTESLAHSHGVDPANICVTNGSTELIYLLPRLIPGKRALIIAPPFAEYARALALAGWEIDYLQLSPAHGFALNWGELESVLAKGYDLLFFCNPGNPTGKLFRRDEICRVDQLCQAAGTFLVVDEAFMDFCEEESSKDAIVKGERGIVLRSMTKFYALPGLRLGYAIGADRLIDRLQELRGPWSVNTLAQVAGLASLADTGYRERTLRLIDTERDFLTARLQAIAGLVPYPSAANYLLVKFQGDISTAKLQERLMVERILIRNCDNFIGLPARFFRVAVRGRQENERLLTALGVVCNNINGASTPLSARICSLSGVEGNLLRRL